MLSSPLPSLTQAVAGQWFGGGRREQRLQQGGVAAVGRVSDAGLGAAGSGVGSPGAAGFVVVRRRRQRGLGGARRRHEADGDERIRRHWP